jgi:YD repeat-containing protein
MDLNRIQPLRIVTPEQPRNTPFISVSPALIDPFNQETKYEYNAQGLATKIVDPTGRSTYYRWNEFGELKKFRVSVKIRGLRGLRNFWRRSPFVLSEAYRFMTFLFKLFPSLKVLVASGTY